MGLRKHYPSCWHGVTPEEAEEVFEHITVFTRSEHHLGELRFVEVGYTDGGRMLEVLTTQRGGKTRVITAYKATKSALLAFHLAVGGA